MGLADVGFPEESFRDEQDLSLSVNVSIYGPARNLPRPLSIPHFAVRSYGA